MSKLDSNKKNGKITFTQNSISMNTTQIISINKNDRKNIGIIDKNEIFNEFINLQKLKQSNNNLNPSNQKVEQDNKIKLLSNKFPSANKFVNNRNVNNVFGNSEPKKIISSSFKKLKAGVTYTGNLYNNKMESKIF